MAEHKQSVRLQLSEVPSPGAPHFEILFIQQGAANGWTFPRRVLEDSAALWEGCSVFVDHSFHGHSVRDLAGVRSHIRYAADHDGLTADLTPAGPSKEVLLEAARVLLDEGSAHPDMGFSADVVFTADAQNNVEKIMQPLSVDLVIDPAFATKFIRQLNQSKGDPMADPIPTQADAEATAHLRELVLAQEIEAGTHLVELKLRNADLPAAAEAEIRARFAGKTFDPKDLDRAVNTWKSAMAEATAGDEIQGPRRISGMFDSRDQITAAVDDLVGAPREAGAESLKVAKFSGVREAYIHLTGDREFVGGYFPDRVQFQHTAANFPGLVANSLNKALAREWAQLGRAGYDWWQKVATVEHFNTLNDITWMLFGTVGSIPTVLEGAEYTELKIGDGYETSSFVKKGGYIGLTLEAMDKDDTRKLRAIPRELANAGLREISSLVAAVFTTASGAGPTMTDTGALFNAVAVTTKGGHANLLTTALGTDFAAWDAVSKAMYDQPMLIANETGTYGTGKKMAVEPKYCLVPRALKAQAEALFIPRWAPAALFGSAADLKGGPTYGGYVEPITVPEWTDATDWAAVADPAIVPGIMIGERFGLVPQIFVAGSEIDPAMFANDEQRIKVRHFVAVGVADFRPLHKENVGG